ncbi:hypothetical protein PG997_005591 [Apiospora hydei]|uniref:DUF1304 domain-containing protein n=1 Tax=Apiospora hydei TaxID=1337664 RepID=A0ABR1WPA5_9PEZI
MPLLSTAATGLMAGLHGYIMTKTLAANQGLYNGFLAAGFVWALAHPSAEVARQIQLFFLGCVGVAGVYGGLTASRKILFVQAVPAAISGAVVLLGL